MSPSTPSADRPWHAQAGDLLADDYNVPGIIMCAIGVVGLACTLVAAGTEHTGWAVVAGIATLLFIGGGVGALMFEHHREKKIEQALGRTGHAPGHAGPQRYSAAVAMPRSDRALDS
ncbi:hypothetical protein ACFWUP_00895 [Nocardia sp. NPDC058658]|uniref:hypothetical protein n=1 Tax=Nocardia sp. NPDC058658 TaxID=3346580 RepID=UPI00364893E8